MLHQNSGGIGKSIPDAREISRGKSRGSPSFWWSTDTISFCLYEPVLCHRMFPLHTTLRRSIIPTLVLDQLGTLYTYLNINKLQGKFLPNSKIADVEHVQSPYKTGFVMSDSWFLIDWISGRGWWLRFSRCQLNWIGMKLFGPSVHLLCAHLCCSWLELNTCAVWMHHGAISRRKEKLLSTWRPPSFLPPSFLGSQLTRGVRWRYIDKAYRSSLGCSWLIVATTPEFLHFSSCDDTTFPNFDIATFKPIYNCPEHFYYMLLGKYLLNNHK